MLKYFGVVDLYDEMSAVTQFQIWISDVHRIWNWKIVFISFRALNTLLPTITEWTERTHKDTQNDRWLITWAGEGIHLSKEKITFQFVWWTVTKVETEELTWNKWKNAISIQLSGWHKNSFIVCAMIELRLRAADETQYINHLAPMVHHCYPYLLAWSSTNLRSWLVVPPGESLINCLVWNWITSSQHFWAYGVVFMFLVTHISLYPTTSWCKHNFRRVYDVIPPFVHREFPL